LPPLNVAGVGSTQTSPAGQPADAPTAYACGVVSAQARPVVAHDEATLESHGVMPETTTAELHVPPEAVTGPVILAELMPP